MYSLVESNNYLKNLINQNKPFFITRTSLGSETLISYYYITNTIKMVNKEIFHMLDNNYKIEGGCYW